MTVLRCFAMLIHIDDCAFEDDDIVIAELCDALYNQSEFSANDVALLKALPNGLLKKAFVLCCRGEHFDTLFDNKPMLLAGMK